MCAWKECLQHINAVLGIVSERSGLQPSQHFTALLLMVLLYTNAPSSIQGGVTAAMEAVCSALVLGYTGGNEATYVRNGALLSVLLWLGASPEDRERGVYNELSLEVHAQVEYILPKRSDPIFWSKTPAAHLFAIRILKSSKFSFPLSTTSLDSLLRNLGSHPDPRLVLSQTESHLFLNTLFSKQILQQPDAPCLATITKLPTFDLERAFKPVYTGRLESIHSLLALWTLHKASDCGVGDEAEEVATEEKCERQLRYLGKWHVAARD